MDILGYFRRKLESDTPEIETPEKDTDDLRQALSAFIAEGEKQWETTSTILNLFKGDQPGPVCPKCKSGNVDLGYG